VRQLVGVILVLLCGSAPGASAPATEPSPVEAAKRSAMGDGAKLKDLERQIDQWRKAAGENLPKLARDQTLKLAAEHRALLAAQDESVDLAKPPRTTIIERRFYDPFNPDPAKRRIVEREERK
jgi:hypothetical protein